MTYWAWPVGGLALAGVMFLHWVTTGRMMAVSGRFTALVNRARLGPQEDAPAMTEAELVAALRAATAAEFGADAVTSGAEGPGGLGGVESVPPDLGAAAAHAGPARIAQAVPDHVLFLVALVVGGMLSAVLSGRFHFTMTLAGAGFTRLTRGSGALGAAVLVTGGVFVGFGTRMAGGCTSGHGMCGVSRFQKGSLLATAAFFGTGVAAAFALGLLG